MKKISINEKKHKNEIAKFKEEKQDLKDENERLKTQIKSLETKKTELNKIIDYLKNNSNSKECSFERSNKLIYETLDLPVEVEILTTAEKLKLTSSILNAIKNLNANEYILVEGNADNIPFLNDFNNGKNLQLAFKRAVMNVLEIDEEKINNNIQFKLNTLSNKRNINVYIVSYISSKKD